MSISLVVNVEDLFPYRGTFEPPTLSAGLPIGFPSLSVLVVVPRPPPPPQFHANQIEEVLDTQDIGYSRGGSWHYLVCWKNQPAAENTWITKDDFRILIPHVFQQYISHYSPDESLFFAGEK